MSLTSFILSFITPGFLIHLCNFVLYILAAGPIPAHVGFVMDGNRRYARLRNKPVQDGHRAGLTALRRMLGVCFRLGVKCVSVYAFSIENFNREKGEVDALLKLFEEVLEKHGHVLDEYGIRLNVIGKRELLPEYLQRAICKAEKKTLHNSRGILNICMPYTARDEISTAVRSTVYQALRTSLTARVTEHDITSNLMTVRAGSPPLDVLVRTSGVKRLSDFMLWQCCENTQIHFIDTYWPEFNLWDFVPVILEYQRNVWARTDKGSKQRGATLKKVRGFSLRWSRGRRS